MIEGRSLSVVLPSGTVQDNDENLFNISGIEDGDSTAQDQASLFPHLYADVPEDDEDLIDWTPDTEELIAEQEPMALIGPCFTALYQSSPPTQVGVSAFNVIVSVQRNEYDRVRHPPVPVSDPLYPQSTSTSC